MFRCIPLILTALLFSVYSSAQSVPTSYDAAKKIGEAKLLALKKTNEFARVQYVVLKKCGQIHKLIKNDNTVYILDRVYNLKGKTFTMPHNAVLVIRNGNIINGTIVGQNTKYCTMADDIINCKLAGAWEKIAPIYAVSDLGLISNNKAYSRYNYTKLKEAIKSGYNLFIDGQYYVSFDNPLMLNYTLHLYGGSLIFTKHAFDLTDNGGMYANGVHFSSLDGSNTDDIICGTRDKHPAVMMGPVTFLNCHFSCNRVLSIEFEYANPAKISFGLHSVELKNCFSDKTGKVILLDAPIQEGFHFQNNVYTNFSHAPIYLAQNHSRRTHPNELNTNPWTEEIVNASGNVLIDSNIFIGREVSDPSYYCAALVIAKKCTFSNNYLKDIVNYSDKKSNGYTAYDAYLSCSDVFYDNNYIENMMSYAKDGASKPQCEIGKSKMNPLESFGVRSSRRYENNIFICDGDSFIKNGADKSSIVTSIFCNVSPIDSYIWRNNAVIYKNVVLDGRHSSTKYGSFIMTGSYFECAEFSGNLIFPNSAYNCSEICINNNVFRTNNSSTVVLINQLYEKNFNDYLHGKISVIENAFQNATPVTHFFVADSVRIKRNIVEDVSLKKNTYLSNYTGEKTTLSVGAMDSELVLDTRGQSKGGAHQFFSSTSSGQYFVEMKDVPEKGIYYYYQVGADHSFQIVWCQNEKQNTIDFCINRGTVSYSYQGQEAIVKFGQTEPIVWNSGQSPIITTIFEKGTPNRIITSISGHSKSTVRFGYVGK